MQQVHKAIHTNKQSTYDTACKGTLNDQRSSHCIVVVLIEATLLR